eukprot:2361009-Prorocentrum_lima.AAC.1
MHIQGDMLHDVDQESVRVMGEILKKHTREFECEAMRHPQQRKALLQQFGRRCMEECVWSWWTPGRSGMTRC